jgi:hypothetical protein
VHNPSGTAGANAWSPRAQDIEPVTAALKLVPERIDFHPLGLDSLDQFLAQIIILSYLSLTA